MNPKALIVIAWVGLSGYVLFRDWSDKTKAMQELTGIWLLSVGSLILAEMDDTLGLAAQGLLVADVLIQPGNTNAGTSFAATAAKILPGPTTPTPAQPATTGVLA